MEALVVASVSSIVGFLFGIWFYWKVILPYLAKGFLKKREAMLKEANPGAYAELKRRQKENHHDRV